MRPRKRFGQHFLESTWAVKVAKAVEPRAGDVILEIGPGRGAMTHLLGAAAARVLAFEIDRDLVPGLREAAAANVTIVEGDFLGVSAGTSARNCSDSGFHPPPRCGWPATCPTTSPPPFCSS